MSAHLRARIKPELLVWARRNSLYSVEAAAKKIGISADALRAWEADELQPTIRQLRRTARLYRYSLAVFYLAEPPADKFQPIRDYRRIDGAPAVEVSPELNLAIKDARDRRESTLELYQLLDEKPPEFSFQSALSKDSEQTGAALRDYLEISGSEQARWREPRNAFAAIRSKLERKGVLVFQVKAIPIEEARGLAIPSFPLPAAVVNRSDAIAGRLFSLIHETTHIALRMEGLCNITESDSEGDGQRNIETFCNRVAAAALVPREAFLSQPTISTRRPRTWTIDYLGPLATPFAVSRYVIARRLLTFNLISPAVYERLVEELNEELARLPRQKGMITPAANVVSLSGRLFPALVLEAFSRDRISASTVASYLGIQLRHLDKVRRSLETAI